MKKEHWLIPLGILSVVVAIWAALRKSGSSPTVVVQSSPSIQPIGFAAGQGITPLGAPPVDPYAMPTGPTGQNAAVPGTSASGVPNYTAQSQLMGGSDAQPAPAPGGTVPTFYGPLQSFIASMIPQMEASVPAPKKDGCGCGGGGSACGTCSVSCSSNSRYTDGAGGCLAFDRAAQIKQAEQSNPGLFMRASENIKSSGVDTFDVFQQTVMDYFAASPGSTPPASPFLSSV